MWFKLQQLSVKLQENSNNLITARHNFVTRKSKNTTEKNIAESFGILKQKVLTGKASLLTCQSGNRARHSGNIAGRHTDDR